MGKLGSEIVQCADIRCLPGTTN